MNRRTFLAASTATLCAATPAMALDFTRIRSERAFRMLIADRALVDEFGGTLLFDGRGRIAGQREALRLSGGWRWQDEALCHRTRIDGLEFERDCKFLYIRGDTLVMQAKRGRSSQSTYTLR